MMNDIMEKLIKNNREKLMSDLPAGHRERFAMKMMSQRDNKATSQRVNVHRILQSRHSKVSRNGGARERHHRCLR